MKLTPNENDGVTGKTCFPRARIRKIGWRLLIKCAKAALVVVLVIGLAGASYAAYSQIIIARGNFHSVEGGQYYRSAQLSKEKFIEEIAGHHIKSILNLRGPNVGRPWYDDEIAAAQAQGVAHYNFAISAQKAVSAEKIDRILDILRKAPKPILVHCRAGADRTGLVTALYRYAIQGRSAGEAERELSLLYGHFPYLTSKSGAMDASFHAYLLAHPAAGRIKTDQPE